MKKEKTGSLKDFRKQVRRIVAQMNKEERKQLKRQRRLQTTNARKSIKEQHRIWREAVFKRDNWTCQVCGTSYKDYPNNAGFHPMHILSKENYPGLRFDVNNGVSGCYYCHKNGPISSHHDGFIFSIWLEKNKPEQYEYLKKIIYEKKLIK
jgi:hypothetical protein